jgi:hypothetical protein
MDAPIRTVDVLSTVHVEALCRRAMLSRWSLHADSQTVPFPKSGGFRTFQKCPQNCFFWAPRRMHIIPQGDQGAYALSAVISPPFYMHGHQWQLVLLPRGYRAAQLSNRASVFVVMHSQKKKMEEADPLTGVTPSEHHRRPQPVPSVSFQLSIMRDSRDHSESSASDAMSSASSTIWSASGSHVFDEDVNAVGFADVVTLEDITQFHMKCETTTIAKDAVKKADPPNADFQKNNPPKADPPSGDSDPNSSLPLKLGDSETFGIEIRIAPLNQWHSFLPGLDEDATEQASIKMLNSCDDSSSIAKYAASSSSASVALTNAKPCPSVQWNPTTVILDSWYVLRIGFDLRKTNGRTCRVLRAEVLGTDELAGDDWNFSVGIKICTNPTSSTEMVPSQTRTIPLNFSSKTGDACSIALEQPGIGQFPLAVTFEVPPSIRWIWNIRESFEASVFLGKTQHSIARPYTHMSKLYGWNMQLIVDAPASVLRVVWELAHVNHLCIRADQKLVGSVKLSVLMRRGPDATWTETLVRDAILPFEFCALTSESVKPQSKLEISVQKWHETLFLGKTQSSFHLAIESEVISCSMTQMNCPADDDDGEQGGAKREIPQQSQATPDASNPWSGQTVAAMVFNANKKQRKKQRKKLAQQETQQRQLFEQQQKNAEGSLAVVSTNSSVPSPWVDRLMALNWLPSMSQYHIPNHTGYVVTFANHKFPQGSAFPSLIAYKADRCGLLQSTQHILNARTTEFHENLTASEMEANVRRLAKSNFEDYSYLLILLLSHGSSSETILGTDGVHLSLASLLSNFQGNKCPTLRGKPKLFITQLCRGNTIARGSAYKVPPPATSSTFIATAQSSTTAKTTPSVPPPATPTLRLFTDHAFVANEADFLVAQSCCTGKISWTNTLYGSWYISFLLRLLTLHALPPVAPPQLSSRLHFTDILLRTHQEMSVCLKAVEGYGTVFQMPCVVHSLTRKLFFTC